jgi:hypothetical protein
MCHAGPQAGVKRSIRPVPITENVVRQDRPPSSLGSYPQAGVPTPAESVGLRVTSLRVACSREEALRVGPRLRKSPRPLAQTTSPSLLKIRGSLASSHVNRQTSGLSFYLSIASPEGCPASHRW